MSTCKDDHGKIKGVDLVPSETGSSNHMSRGGFDLKPIVKKANPHYINDVLSIILIHSLMKIPSSWSD